MDDWPGRRRIRPRGLQSNGVVMIGRWELGVGMYYSLMILSLSRLRTPEPDTERWEIRQR